MTERIFELIILHSCFHKIVEISYEHAVVHTMKEILKYFKNSLKKNIVLVFKTS